MSEAQYTEPGPRVIHDPSLVGKVALVSGGMGGVGR